MDSGWMNGGHRIWEIFIWCTQYDILIRYLVYDFTVEHPNQKQASKYQIFHSKNEWESHGCGKGSLFDFTLPILKDPCLIK